MTPAFLLGGGCQWETPACQWETVNESLDLLCLCAYSFCFAYWTVFISIHEFSLLPFGFSPPTTWGEWASICVVLSCLLGLNHNCGSCLPVANSVSTVILEIKRDSKGEFFKRPIQIKPLTFKTKEYSVHQLVQIKSFWMWSSVNNILSFTSKESLVVLFFEV